jgi:hypothetical protein
MALMDQKLIIHRIKQKTVKLDDHRLYLQKEQPRIGIHRKRIQIAKIAYAIANGLTYSHAASLNLVATCGYPMCIEPAHLEVDGPDVIIAPRKGIPYDLLNPRDIPKVYTHPYAAKVNEKVARDRLLRAATKYFTNMKRQRAERTSENIYYGQRKTKFDRNEIDQATFDSDTQAHNIIIQRLDDVVTDCEAILLAHNITLDEAKALFHRAEWLRKANESRAKTRQKRLESRI